MDERGAHVKPSDVIADPTLVAQRIRIGPSLTPAAISVELHDADPGAQMAQLQAICHLARLSHVTLLTIPAAPTGADLPLEKERLGALVRVAEQGGCILCVVTRMGTVTESPDAAVELCRDVTGLGLTLDPSHYISGPHGGQSFDQVYPFVRHVHLRDSGRGENQFQLRVGQGEVEYGRIISQLARHHYNRLLTVEMFDIPDAPWIMEQEVRKLKYLLESLV